MEYGCKLDVCCSGFFVIALVAVPVSSVRYTHCVSILAHNAVALSRARWNNDTIRSTIAARRRLNRLVQYFSSFFSNSLSDRVAQSLFTLRRPRRDYLSRSSQTICSLSSFTSFAIRPANRSSQIAATNLILEFFQKQTPRERRQSSFSHLVERDQARSNTG